VTLPGYTHFMPSIAHLIHAYGLLVVAGVVGLEGVGIPLPGETALIIASVIAGSKHELNIVAVIVVAAGASIVGRIIGYLIGRNFGYWLLLRYGGYVRLTAARVKLGQYLFLRHGGKIIIIAQFIPILRTLAGILAGANRMPRHHFMVANIAGACIWATFFGIAAYSLGRQVERLAGSVVFVCGVGALIAVFIAANFVKGHEAQLAAEAERALPGPLELP
jgi:membrane protein DedA with SNARE-associated domain